METESVLGDGRYIAPLPESLLQGKREGAQAVVLEPPIIGYPDAGEAQAAGSFSDRAADDDEC